MGTILGKVSDAGPGGFAIYDVAGQRVAVANVGGKYYAFVDRCTHMGCPLSNGPVDGTTVTCLCHGSKFDFTTGAVLVGPARAPLDSYPVKVVGDEIELLLAEPEAQPPLPAREEVRASETAAAPPEAAPVAAKESVLAKVPLFSILEPATIEALEAFTFRRQFEPGDIIVEEGRTGNGLYIVVSGKVEVVKGLDRRPGQVVATFGPGEPFGEMALIGDWPRSASVRALEATECLGMDRWVFLLYLNKEPQLAIRLLQILAKRLMEAGEKLSE
jgi:nitrite reductase/ring-hydroxylating ferredoxin subunit